MFLAFLATIAPSALVLPWHQAVMAGFDMAAIAFMLSVTSLIRADAAAMRRKAAANLTKHGVLYET